MSMAVQVIKSKKPRENISALPHWEKKYHFAKQNIRCQHLNRDLLTFKHNRQERGLKFLISISIYVSKNQV